MGSILRSKVNKPDVTACVCTSSTGWGEEYIKEFCGSPAMSIAELVRPRLTETPSGKITCEVILEDTWHHPPDPHVRTFSHT